MTGPAESNQQSTYKTTESKNAQQESIFIQEDLASVAEKTWTCKFSRVFDVDIDLTSNTQTHTNTHSCMGDIFLILS